MNLENLRPAPKAIISYKEYTRMRRALELILKWEPSYKPPPGYLPCDLYLKLQDMNLWATFQEREK